MLLTRTPAIALRYSIAALALKLYTYFMNRFFFRCTLFVVFSLILPTSTILAKNKPVFGFTPLSSSGIHKYDAAILSQQSRKEIDAAGV